ncbi:uncharacterized protein [Paramormyrops kingsleyae]|uniref:uncharacterized protein n=1 Tax=Paramormyrops kingsleyae TaxID=1676925 RepID=UPI003B9700E6
MLFRIILGENDIRKIHADCLPETLDDFLAFLKCKLAVDGSFVVQFQDPDFNNEFCNLTNLAELPKEKATLKVIVQPTLESNNTDPTIDVGSSSTASSLDNPTSGGRRSLPCPFPIPKFTYDVELQLRRGNEAYHNNGNLLDISKDTKSEILEKLAEAIYAFTPYPQRDDFDNVAQSLINKHPCLKEPGSEKGWYCWKYSLKFKMGNYRSKLRAAGCAELQVNRHSASSDLGTKRKLKKANKAETNFLPDLPQDKSPAMLEKERESMVVEMKKRKVDWNKMCMMMANTFSVRRKEIVENEPLVKEIEAEFTRLTSKDLMNAFLSGLDQYVPRFLQMFKAKMSSISQLESLLSKVDSDNSVNEKGHCSSGPSTLPQRGSFRFLQVSRGNRH